MKAEWLKYKLYVFDLDDTLYRETDYLFAAYGRIGAYLAGGDAVKAQEYTRFLCDSFKQDGRQGLFQRLSERYTLHVPTEQLLGILRSTSCPLEMYEPMRQVLDELLQAGKAVAILTNGNPQQQQQKTVNLRIAQLYPRIEIVYAATIASKPSPEALHQLMSAHQSDAAQTVLIGNSETDRQTALNAGIDYIEACYLTK